MKLKNWAAALMGILLGLIIAIPVFWHGIQRGIETMYTQAEMDFETVESRLQTMADQSYELRKLLSEKGWRGDYEPFEAVEARRSWLHGTFPLAAKMELAEDLERKLLEVESIWATSGRRRGDIRNNPYHRGWGQQWEKLKRLLVKEENIFVLSVAEYTAALNSRAFRFFYDGYNMREVLKLSKYRITVEEEGKGGAYKPKFRMHTGKRSFDIDADVAGMATGVRDKDGRVVFFELPRPYWIAEAPMPEFDYKEIQYDRDTTIMSVAEIESQHNNVTDEIPVYENRAAPEAFEEPRSKKQKKVIY